MACYRDCYVILSLGIAAACSNHGCLIMKQARACMVMVIQQISWERICHSVEYSYGRRVPSQVAQARNMSIGEHHHCCVTFEIWGFVWEKKTYRFCNLRKWKDVNKKQHTLLKMCVASVLCSPRADLWPCYRFLCKRFSLYLGLYPGIVNRTQSN